MKTSKLTEEKRKKKMLKTQKPQNKMKLKRLEESVRNRETLNLLKNCSKISLIGFPVSWNLPNLKSRKRMELLYRLLKKNQNKNRLFNLLELKSFFRIMPPKEKQLQSQCKLIKMHQKTQKNLKPKCLFQKNRKTLRLWYELFSDSFLRSTFKSQSLECQAPKRTFLCWLGKTRTKDWAPILKEKCLTAWLPNLSTEMSIY